MIISFAWERNYYEKNTRHTCKNSLYYYFFNLMRLLWMELWALSNEPKEYIVIRDGKKCVASVSSWNDSSVECHEYKGLFWMGEKIVSYEIYHRTNDPFESGAAPFEK